MALSAVADPPGGVVGALWGLVAPVGAVRGEVAVGGGGDAPGVRVDEFNLCKDLWRMFLQLRICVYNRMDATIIGFVQFSTK